ncbi:MAG: peptide deformylase [Solobacterium sp.]|nr:peptide deformylase [Solobacterium sp.]
MSHEIVRDPIFLSVKSEPAEKSDISLGMELIQALQENSGKCVGMAANMIGVRKRIIAINTGKGFFALMFNPVIIEKSGLYDSQEGCLSLDGVRNTKRYRDITVEYTDLRWKKLTKKFSGLEAQIIQHEMDHLEGILV